MNQNGRDCHIRCVKLFTPRIASDVLPGHIYKHQHVVPILKSKVKADSERCAMDSDSDSGDAGDRGQMNSKTGKFVFSLKCSNQIIR